MTGTAEILAALDMVAFSRQPDGTFRAIGAVPPWFRTLYTDLTFPFLGTFLETAGGFWAESKDGCLWSGPCAQTDESGAEFHFEVAAVTAGTTQFLIFERRPEVEAMQHVLQKARELSLEHEQLTHRLDNLRSTQAGALMELARMAQGVVDVAASLRATPMTPAQQPLVESIAESTQRVVSGLETTLRALGRRS
jgi:hypothetical protein